MPSNEGFLTPLINEGYKNVDGFHFNNSNYHCVITDLFFQGIIIVLLILLF